MGDIRHEAHTSTAATTAAAVRAETTSISCNYQVSPAKKASSRWGRYCSAGLGLHFFCPEIGFLIRTFRSSLLMLSIGRKKNGSAWFLKIWAKSPNLYTATIHTAATAKYNHCL